MDADRFDRRLALAGLGMAAGAMISRVAEAGSLTPPAGPVAPTGKSLQEIYDRIARTDVGLAEPRIPVQSLPGSATALHVISQPGSYYLTGNITGVAGKNGIEIVCDDVTLDLAGFLMDGVPDSLVGILVEGRSNMTVLHGVVRHWGSHGIKLTEGAGGANSKNSLIKGIRADDNGGGGVEATYSVLIECSASRNSSGAFSGYRISVINCQAADNRSHGIGIEHGIIMGCRVNGSQWAGLYANGGALITQCVSVANGGEGITTASFCTVSNCHVYNNYVGIKAWDATNRIVGNTVLTDWYPQGKGILVEDPNAHNLIIANSVVGYNTPYDIAAGNSYGPIVNVANVGDISSVPGANHPWANFAY